MNILRIEILNPKALRLLTDLAKLKLISINSKAVSDFSALVGKLRSNASNAPSFDEITKEVELVRAKRNGK